MDSNKKAGKEARRQLHKNARAILNKSWRQHPTRHQLYGHLPPITKTIQVRRTRHAGHCWRSRDELKSDVLLWTPTHGRGKAGRPARTYIQQLCEDTGCSPEDLPEAMNDRESGERWSGISVLLLYFDPRPGLKMLFQGDTPEGSDTFQRPVIERDRVGGLRLMIWEKVKVPFCHYSHAPEESNL